jgi:hypothetical protein
MTARPPHPLYLPALGAVALMAPLASLEPAHAACSVLDHQPCAPSFCSVLRRGPCIPDDGLPFGDHLRLNVQSRPDVPANPPAQLDNFKDLDAALRRCWLPPSAGEGKPGTELTILISFNRAGEILGEPRFVYFTPGLSSDLRATYQRAVAATLKRCTPLPLTKGFGAALAGRVFSIRFIDNTDIRKPERAT